MEHAATARENLSMTINCDHGGRRFYIEEAVDGALSMRLVCSDDTCPDKLLPLSAGIEQAQALVSSAVKVMRCSCGNDAVVIRLRNGGKMLGCSKYGRKGGCAWSSRIDIPDFIVAKYRGSDV